MPFPPIFNIHAYNTLDLANYFSEYKNIPFIEPASLVPSAAHASMYPQQIIHAYILSLFNISSIDSNSINIIISNITTISFFLIAGIILLPLLKYDILYIILFISIILGIPPIFEVFVKYASSDVFTILVSSVIIYSSIYFLKTSKTYLLLFIIAFSNILRIYFAIICLLFLFLLSLYLFIFFKKEFFSVLKTYFSKKLNIAFIILCLMISSSWFFTFYHKYESIPPDFTNVGLFSNKSLTDEQKLAGDFSYKISKSNV